jgi:hypothetical protein
MKHAPDVVDHRLDEIAEEYYARLPRELWADVGVDVSLSDHRLTWWTEKPEVRDQLRQVAQRFIDGDERLAIWRLKMQALVDGRHLNR